MLQKTFRLQEQMRCVDEFKPPGKTGVLKFPGLCLILSLGRSPDGPAASLALTPGSVMMVLLISLLVRYGLQNENRRFCILLRTPPSDPP